MHIILISRRKINVKCNDDKDADRQMIGIEEHELSQELATTRAEMEKRMKKKSDDSE